MKSDKNFESDLAAYRDLPSTQNLDEDALQTIAAYQHMDRELSNLATHTRAEAAQRFGNRLANEFRQRVAGPSPSAEPRQRFGGLERVPKYAVQIAGMSLGLVLLAVLALALSIPLTRMPMSLGQPRVWKTGNTAPNLAQLSRFAYGIAVDTTGPEPVDTVYRAVTDLGLTWVKQDVSWETYQPSAKMRPVFDRLLRGLTSAQETDLKTLLSVSGAPTWTQTSTQASSVNDGEGTPPVDAEMYAAFLGELATAVCHTSVKAIEVWDEQNMRYAWADQTPDPHAYMDLLKAAHSAIKNACPTMLIISGGLTPAGQNPPQSVDNLIYMDKLLALGMTKYADGIGVHLPGYNVPPTADLASACKVITADHAHFRGACDSPHHSWSFRSTLDEYQALLVKYQVVDQQLWVTEFGWPSGIPVNSSYAYVDDNSREEQAQWTLAAFDILQSTPAVGPAFLSNLNAGLGAPNVAAAQWHIWDPDGEQLPVYTQLRNKPK